MRAVHVLGVSWLKKTGPTYGETGLRTSLKGMDLEAKGERSGGNASATERLQTPSEPAQPPLRALYASRASTADRFGNFMADEDRVYINAPRLWDDGLVHFTKCYESLFAAGNHMWMRICDKAAKNWVFNWAPAVTCFECLAKEDQWDTPA